MSYKSFQGAIMGLMTSTKQKRPRVVLVNRAVVLNKKREILLIKRARNDSWQPGKWELPGGKLEEGQDISHALEKEVLEESGLLSLPLTRMAYVESQILTSGKYKDLPYVVIVGITKLTGGKIKLSQEHEDYTWVKPNEAFDYDITEETRKALATLKSRL